MTTSSVAGHGRASARSILLLGGSGIAAAVPIGTLAIAAQTLTAAQQGVVAIGITIGGYLAQLLGAVLIEARLATPHADDPRLPRLLLYLGLVGAVVVSAGAANPVVLVFGLLLALPVLELGRVVCVVSGRAGAEARGAVAIVVSLVAAVWASQVGFGPPWAILAVGLVGALLSRRAAFEPGGWRFAPWPVTRPVLLETAATGSVQPLLTIAVTGLIGPLAAVGVRVLVSLGAIMSPAIGFLRLRLISHQASPHDRVVGLGVLAVSAAVVAVLGATPMAGALFGEAWQFVTPWSLTALIVWRLLVAASAFPFAQLRVSGRVSELLVLRCYSTLLYLGLTLPAALLAGVTGIIAGCALAELLTFLLYRHRARRPDRRLADVRA